MERTNKITSSINWNIHKYELKYYNFVKETYWHHLVCSNFSLLDTTWTIERGTNGIRPLYIENSFMICTNGFRLKVFPKSQFRTEVYLMKNKGPFISQEIKEGVIRQGSKRLRDKRGQTQISLSWRNLIKVSCKLSLLFSQRGRKKRIFL